MNPENRTMLLRDAEILPSDEVIENALGVSAFAAYKELIEQINAKGIEPEWHYYNDGKAWLCKVAYKKKTVFWLSVWENFMKTTFYFTAKNCMGIFDLKINNSIKTDFELAKSIGKLIPLTLELSDKEQLADLMEIIKYKVNLK